MQHAENKGMPHLPPRLYGLDRAMSINACRVVTVDYADVAFLNLDLKACSIRLVSLATFLKKNFPTFFFMLGFQLGSFFILHLSFLSECYRCSLMGDLYFNMLNENHVIMQSKYKMQK